MILLAHAPCIEIVQLEFPVEYNLYNLSPSPDRLLTRHISHPALDRSIEDSRDLLVSHLMWLDRGIELGDKRR